MDPENANFLLYGVDDDGPLPELQIHNDVQVPRSSVRLSDNDYNVLVNAVNPLADDGNHGISLYEEINRSVRNILRQK